MKNKTVMIITGEASGDSYGAQLVNAMAEKSKAIDFYGVGSSAMESAGVNILIDSEKLSVMGITEVMSKIPFIIHSIRYIKKSMKKLKINLIILIDFPDFNFHIAKEAKKLSVPVLYYIGPQVWAWRENRIKKIKKLVDRLIVILPFEEVFYKNHTISATFVGHPLLDAVEIRQKILKKNINNNSMLVGLLPGSRNKEVSNILPTMLKSAKLINQSIPSVKFIISHANSISSQIFNKIIAKHHGSLNATISHQPINQILTKCSFLIAASGTVTLEAALRGIPTLIVYKVSALSYFIGKILINVDHIGLVNLILRREIVPELIQEQASYDNIAKTTVTLLKNKKDLLEMRKQLLSVEKYLGKPGATKRVAYIAIKMLNKT